ncbi:unnamed protein product [Discula destructiva]
MSSSQNQDNFDDESQRRSYTSPHSGNHPIPTIQRYREHKREIKDQTEQAEQAQEGPEDGSRPRRAFNSVKQIFRGEDNPQNPHEPYPAANRNYVEPPPGQSGGESVAVDGQGVDARQFQGGQGGEGEGHHLQSSTQAGRQQQQHRGAPKDKHEQPEKSATEHVASTIDPKEKRKAMKKTKRQTGGREVTDPVTHLPIVIHDQTEKDLRSVPENEPEPGEHHTTATGPQGASKSNEEIEKERAAVQRGFNGVQRLFPPPEFRSLKRDLADAYETTMRAGLAVIGLVAASPLLLSAMQGKFIPAWTTVLGLLVFVTATLGTAYAMGKWLRKKVNEIVDDETWDAARRGERAVLDSDTELPESVQWMNSLLASIWPLVNPDLFSSVIDMVEDIMQASLPKVIKMVSVDDMGQGNQSLRILGVRWLPTGAASQSVGPGGRLETPDKSKGPSDRMDPENAQQSQGKGTEETREKDLENGGEQGKDEHGNDENKGQGEHEAIREGMEAEEGDFVNLELAVAYRSRATGKSIRAKAKNAHLFLKFYSVGGIALPVWVEVRGFIATMRLRLQLTPDPPFVSLCTITFLGQPKASLACVPLSKHGLNLMDVPMISGFVQSAIDAALAEYVAPKSLTLNLKDMLMGADFKTDTSARGVVLVRIKRARGFKQGDGGVRQGASDAYCTVSWGKFGKTMASTRVIPGSQEPDWDEYASILVTAEELNAEEKLRLQLWDSDKWTADDDLGRVEVDLKELIQHPETHNKMQDREDSFTGQDPEEKLPGSLQWSVGYFAKVRITNKQIEQQTVNKDIRNTEQLRNHVAEQSANKLREAGKGPDDDELHQQRVQDYAELEDSMIVSAPPLQDFVSGLLSVQIHNITGLEVQKLNKQDKGDDESQGDAENETGDDMPDSYCSIFLNHKKIYRTRTKPKNSKPFFNAGTERFIRDWRSTDIIIAVRDQREREDDPLIGIVYLPLAKVFAKKSQVVDVYPLVGGVGFGRARISMVWRSVELTLPRALAGWDYGTLEVRGSVRAKNGGRGLSQKLLHNRLKLRTDLGKVKVYANGDNGTWSLGKREDREGESAFLAVRKRYASPLLLEFRESALGPDKSPAFAVLWLKDLMDEEVETCTLKVWKGGKDRLARAEHNVDYDGYSEGEQPIGEVELDLKFWRGLSGYHKRFASAIKTGNMREVMECLDTITDENLDEDEDGEGSFTDDEDSTDSGEDGAGDSPVRRGSGDKEARKRLRVHTNDTSSESDADSDGNNGKNGDDGASRSKLSLRNLKKLGTAPKKILKNPMDGTVGTAIDVAAPGHNASNDASRGLGNSLRDYKDHHKQLHRKHRGIMQWRAAREVDHVAGKLGGLKGTVSGIFRHSEKDTGVETEV